MTTAFYKPVKTQVFINVQDRGLDGACAEGGKHKWLLLPKQIGQKQYLYCMKCGEHSHT